MTRPALEPASTTTFSPRWRRIAIPLTLLRLAGQGWEFIAWAVIARRLGAASFGTLAVAFLVARYAGLVGDWGAVALALLAVVILLGYAWSRDWVALGREQGVLASLPVALRGGLVLIGAFVVDSPEGAAWRWRWATGLGPSCRCTSTRIRRTNGGSSASSTA